MQVANMLYDSLEKFFIQINGNIQSDVFLTKEYSELILDNMKCLVHTIGQQYVSDNNHDTKKMFYKCHELQKEFSNINMKCDETDDTSKFACVLSEFNLYKIRHFEKFFSEIGDNEKLEYWICLKEFLLVKMCNEDFNDRVKHYLVMFNEIEEKDFDDADKIKNAAISLVVKISSIVEIRGLP